MHRMIRFFIIYAAAATLTAIPVFAATPTADEIIRKVESNEAGSSQATATFEITDTFGKRTKRILTYEDTNGDMLIEFTNPEEKGQKILRLKNEIYLYYPKAEEIVHLQGDALKDSVMGSDYSYEDLTGGKSLLDKYKATLDRTEEFDGNECYVITLNAYKKDAVYPKQVVWIDTKLYSYRQGEFYSKSGKLIKQMFVHELTTVSGKTIPSDVEMVDTMKKDSKTVFKLGNIKLGVKIDPKLFSLEELSW
jgi:outer membrane lipoprotein-sorting protein